MISEKNIRRLGSMFPEPVAVLHYNDDESFGFVAEEQEFTTFITRRVRACRGFNGSVIIMQHNGWDVASVNFQTRTVLYVKTKPYAAKPDSSDEIENGALR